MSPTCRDALRVEGYRALGTHIGLEHRWDESNETTTLTIPAASSDGFDVQLVATDAAIMLTAGSTFHTDFVDSDPRISTKAAVDLMVRLLSPSMRLRERWAGHSLRSSSLEVLTDSGWATRETFGLVFWNFFGRRTERVFLNHHLASDAEGPPA